LFTEMRTKDSSRRAAAQAMYGLEVISPGENIIFEELAIGSAWASPGLP
jgi:hypothetical protein